MEIEKTDINKLKGKLNSIPQSYRETLRPALQTLLENDLPTLMQEIKYLRKQDLISQQLKVIIDLLEKKT